MTSLSDGGRRLLLETPENVPLAFELAPAGNRALAFFIDLVTITTLVVLLVVLTSLVIGQDALSAEIGDGELLLEAIRTLAVFLVWNFYFIASELRWQGRTLGKRIVGLRVIARDGGPLSSGLVFARNLTRDLETLLPLSVIVNPEIVGMEGALGLILAWGWLGIMAFMPLFNRYHARVGDLLAGTLVVQAPKERLLDDLVAEETASRTRHNKGDSGLAFTQEQLDLYGIHELQILEDVLRRYPGNIDHDLLATIAQKIQTKIAWQSPLELPIEPYEFLRAFYAAQRARLEHKLLFGKRQERKVR